jgi:hypothetical protein
VDVSVTPKYYRAPILSNEVRTLPVTADIIFCPSDTSPTPLAFASSARRCVAVAILLLLQSRQGVCYLKLIRRVNATSLSREEGVGRIVYRGGRGLEW